MSKNNLKIYTWLDDHGSWRHGIHLKFSVLFAKRSFVLWRSTSYRCLPFRCPHRCLFKLAHGEMCGTYGQNNEHHKAQCSKIHIKISEIVIWHCVKFKKKNCTSPLHTKKNTTYFDHISQNCTFLLIKKVRSEEIISNNVDICLWLEVIVQKSVPAFVFAQFF